MKKQFLEAGRIVGTHGVRGMVRIQPWSDDAAFLAQFKTVYLDKGCKKLTAVRVQPHGRMTIAAFEGIDSIEAAEGLRGKIIYISREDAHLPEGRYFIDEIIGCSVFEAENEDRLLGTLTDVSETGANDVWHITSNGKEYLVPAIDDVIVSVDIESEKIIIKPLKGIFDDED